jgi:hypothetical protein
MPCTSMRSTSPRGNVCHVQIVVPLRLNVSRHPKIIEDEKAIEVVLRLEEISRPTAGTNDNGRRFTVTAIGSRLSSDHRRATVTLASIAVGDTVTVPPATEQRLSSEVRRSRRSSSDVAGSDHVVVVVPTQTITNPQYLPHLEAIEETLLGLRSGLPDSHESDYFS